MTRPPREFVDEAVEAHPFIAPDKSCMYLDVLQREVRALRAELSDFETRLARQLEFNEATRLAIRRVEALPAEMLKHADTHYEHDDNESRAIGDTYAHAAQWVERTLKAKP